MIALVTPALICLLVILFAAPAPDQPAPERGLRRRSTGIVGLNLLLEGGFPEGSVIVAHGTPVAGVDIAARTFCFCNPDETGTYLVPEMLIDEAGEGARLMNPAKILERIRDSPRISVDSLSTVIEAYGIEQALFILGLARDEIRESRGNLMVVVYAGVHPAMDLTRILRAADVVIEFKAEISQSEIQRTLAVQKMRGCAVPSRLLPFIITEKGIEASTTSRVV